MATIFRQDEQVLAGPLDFEWADVRQGGPQYPGVYVDGVQADFASLVGGEQITLTRGSTAQVGVVVTSTGPGVVQLATDINAIFGIAGGAPTDFAYVIASNRIRLRDATVGPNAGLAAVVAYPVTAPQGSIVNMGLPIIRRSQVAAASTTRRCSLGTTHDDTSNITSNYFTVPEGTKRLVVDVIFKSPIVGVIPQKIFDKVPIFTLGYSDQTVTQEPPYRTVGQLAIGKSEPLPGLVGGAFVQLSPSLNMAYPPIFNDPIFTSGTAFGTEQEQHAVVEFPVMPQARRVRAILPGCLPTATPFSSNYTPDVSMRIWAIG